MNISFPRMPCELLTLDVMDVSGDVQTGVMHGVNKVRLAPLSDGGFEIETRSLDLYVIFGREDAQSHPNTRTTDTRTTTQLI